MSKSYRAVVRVGDRQRDFSTAKLLTKKRKIDDTSFSRQHENTKKISRTVNAMEPDDTCTKIDDYEIDVNNGTTQTVIHVHVLLNKI